MKTIKHLGIIMDGNRRYSENHDVPAKYAHLIGTIKFLEIIEFLALDKRRGETDELKNLNEVTFYALTIDNIKKRSLEEVNQFKYIITNLLNVLTSTLQKKDLLKSIKLNFIGSYADYLDADITESIKKCTSSFGNFLEEDDDGNANIITINIALCYDYREELNNAINNMIISKDFSLDIFNHLPLSTSIDLVIRTGNVCRTSGFFPLNTAYSEWAFLDIMWPDFTVDKLIEVVKKFDGNGRRFGK